MSDEITTEDAAALLGIKPQTLRRRVMWGMEPHPKKERGKYGKLLFTMESVVNYAHSKAVAKANKG